MSDYVFITQWWFDAPIERVWEAIRDAEQWPTLWRSVVAVRRVATGDESGVGEIRRFTWRGRLPYALTFDMRTTRVEPPTALEGVASGQLEGRGLWRLASESGGTAVRYDWSVRTTKLWMRMLAPVARPLFSWNHDAVMKDGERGLRRLLEGKA